MKLPRIFVSLGALAIVSGALLAAPTPARANDCAMPFGGIASASPINGLFVATTAAHWATTVSAHAWVTSLAMHEDHHELGETSRGTPALGLRTKAQAAGAITTTTATMTATAATPPCPILLLACWYSPASRR